MDKLMQSCQVMSDLLLSVYDRQDWQPEPHEWSFRYIAAHMRQVEIECFYVRIQRILSEDQPHFSYYLNTGWDFSQLDLAESVQDWQLWRERVLQLVAGLSAENRTRTATHDHFDTITIDRILQIAYDHDQEHIEHLRSIMRKLTVRRKT